LKRSSIPLVIDRWSGFRLNWEKWSLAGILLTALIARFYFLVSNRTIGVWYNSRYLRLLALEMLQEKRFILFYAYGRDAHIPIMSWLAIPLYSLFGASDFVYLIPVVLLSTLAVYFCYLLGRELYNVKVGLLSALFLALSAWNIDYMNTNDCRLTGFFFLILSLYLFANGMNQISRKKMILSGIFYLIAIRTCGMNLLVLPIFPLYFFLQGREFYRKHRLLLRSSFFSFLILALILEVAEFIVFKYHLPLGKSMAPYARYHFLGLEMPHTFITRLLHILFTRQAPGVTSSLRWALPYFLRYPYWALPFSLAPLTSLGTFVIFIQAIRRLRGRKGLRYSDLMIPVFLFCHLLTFWKMELFQAKVRMSLMLPFAILPAIGLFTLTEGMGRLFKKKNIKRFSLALLLLLLTISQIRFLSQNIYKNYLKKYEKNFYFGRYLTETGAGMNLPPGYPVDNMRCNRSLAKLGEFLIQDSPPKEGKLYTSYLLWYFKENQTKLSWLIDWYTRRKVISDCLGDIGAKIGYDDLETEFTNTPATNQVFGNYRSDVLQGTNFNRFLTKIFTHPTFNGKPNRLSVVYFLDPGYCPDRLFEKPRFYDFRDDHPDLKPYRIVHYDKDDVNFYLYKFVFDGKRAIGQTPVEAKVISGPLNLKGSATFRSSHEYYYGIFTTSLLLPEPGADCQFGLAKGDEGVFFSWRDGKLYSQTNQERKLIEEIDHQKGNLYRIEWLPNEVNFYVNDRLKTIHVKRENFPKSSLNVLYQVSTSLSPMKVNWIKVTTEPLLLIKR